MSNKVIWIIPLKFSIILFPLSTIFPLIVAVDQALKVSFSISGEPMLDTDGTAIGALGRDSFVFGKLPMK